MYNDVTIVDILFVAIFVLFPVFIALLLKKAGLPLNRIEIPAFVIVAMFVFSYIGILPLYFGWDEYRYAIGVQDKDLILKIYFFSVISITGIATGSIFAKNIVQGSYSAIVYGFRPLSKKETSAILILLLFVFTILLLYLSKTPKVALFIAIFEGEMHDSKIIRSMMSNDFPGKYHWYSVFMHDVANVITFIFFAEWLRNKRKTVLILFFIAFVLSAFSALMTAEKAPFIWLLIGLFLVYTIVKKSGVVAIKHLLIVFILVFFIITLFYMFIMGYMDVDKAISSVVSRAFAGSISPAYFYIEFIPKYQDFLWGRSFTNPGGVLPFEPYRLTVEVANWKFPHLAKQGFVSSSPAVYWAEMYANFGTAGIFAAPVIVGFALYMISFFINKLENSPIKVGLLVWLLIHYKGLSERGISNFFPDFYLLIVLTVVFFIIAISNSATIRLRTKKPRKLLSSPAASQE